MLLRIAAYAIALISGALVLSCGTATWAAEIPWKIDENAAVRLAAEGADHGADARDFDYDSKVSPPFFVFDGVSRPPAEGSFGFFAVNPWTGDVWALWGCRKLSTSALRKSQAAIRRRFTHQESKQYVRLSRLKPECDFED